MRELEIKECKKHMTEGGYALELGCEIGYMTSMISPLVEKLDVVEGSTKFINEAKKRNLPNATFYNCLFEDFRGHGQYDYVFMSHVLEHLIDPQQVLKIVHESLKPTGKLFVIVPNGNAASRRLAQAMGLIDRRFELTPNDIRGGHRRVYYMFSFADELKTAGFEFDIQGLLFKPFADFQMDTLLAQGFLTQDHMDGLAKLGERYPDLCGALMAVCTKEEK
jgi:trans-aconitate methyltransferase